MERIYKIEFETTDYQKVYDYLKKWNMLENLTSYMNSVTRNKSNLYFQMTESSIIFHINRNADKEYRTTAIDIHQQQRAAPSAPPAMAVKYYWTKQAPYVGDADKKVVTDDKSYPLRFVYNRTVDPVEFMWDLRSIKLLPGIYMMVESRYGCAMMNIYNHKERKGRQRNINYMNFRLASGLDDYPEEYLKKMYILPWKLGFWSGPCSAERAVV